MDWSMFNLPSGLQIPQVPAYNPRPSGLSSLAEAISSIAQAQRQRKTDELNLRKAQMAMADAERQRADEAAMRGELQRIAGMTEPVDAYVPTAPKEINPLSPVPMIPEMQPGQQQMPLSDERVDEMLSQAALKMGNYDMLQKVRTNLVNKRAERELKAQGYEVQREKIKQGLLLGFLKNPKGLKMVSPQVISSAGLSLDAINAMPEDTDEDAGIQYFDDPIMGRRPYVRTKQGAIHWLDSYAAGVGLAQARAQASGEQARLTGQALGRDVETFTDAQGGVWERKKQVGAPVTPVRTQPVTPTPAGQLPATMPPGIKTPNPSNRGADVAPTPPTNAQVADADAKFLMGEGVGSSPVSLDMTPARATGSSTVDLYRDQLKTKVNTPDVEREVNNILGAIRQNPDLKRFEPVNVVASKLESEFNPEMINSDGSYTRAVTNPGIQDNILMQQFLSAFDPKVGIIRPAEIEKFMAQYSFPVRMSQMALKTGLGQGYDEGGIGEMVAIMTPSMRKSMLDAMNRLLSKATEQMAPAYSEALNSTTSEVAKVRVRSSIPAIIRRALEKGPDTPNMAAPGDRFEVIDGVLRRVK